MAWAQCDAFGKAVVGMDAVGYFTVFIGGVSVHIEPEDAPRVRDELSRLITESARKSALDVAATEEAGAAIAKAAAGETP